MLKFIKLAKIVAIQVIGSMEDECTFNILSFMKSKLKNRFTSHLDLVIRTFSQHLYTFEKFPYDLAIEKWKEIRAWYADNIWLLKFYFFGIFTIIQAKFFYCFHVFHF
jgi:hypothetical protein